MEALFKRPRLIVAAITAITLFFAFFLAKVELDNNNLRFVPEDDPALETSRRIDETFGSSLFILVGLERENGTVFDGDFLNRIRDFVDEVKTMPIVKEIVSLVSADYITSVDGAIVVESLVRDDFSGLREEIAALKSRLLSWDIYERAMVSDDFSSTQILIPLTISQEEASLPEVSEMFLEIRDMAHKTFDGFSNVYVTGMPVITATINEEMTSDLKLLIPLVVIVVLAVLFFSFRRFTRVILPMLTVLVAVVWSMGAMPLFGIKLSVISTVLPVILVAVGSAYGIHVVTHYLTDRTTAQMSRDEHKLYVIDVLRKIIKPVFLAAITTFAGFFSLCFTAVHPIREFGCFSCFGVIVSFAVSVTLIPSLLIIKGPEKETGGKKNEARTTLIPDLFTAAAERKKTVVALAACVMAVSVFGLTKIITDNAMIEYFKPDTGVFKSDKFIRDNFGGSKVVNVVLESDSYETTMHPGTLTALDGLGAYLEKMPEVGKVMGFTDMVKRINQILYASDDPSQTAAEETDFNDDFGFGFDDFGFDFGFGFSDFDGGGYYTGETASVGVNNADNAVAVENYLPEREFFALLEEAAGDPFVVSANDLVKALKRELNYEGAAYYEIPSDPLRYGKQTPEDLQRLMANYLVLLSGGISSYANDPLEPTAVKSTVQLKTLGMDDTEEVVGRISAYLEEHAPPEVNVTIGGAALVESSLNNLIVQSQLTSVIISVICVFIIVAVSNRSLIAGITGVLPLSISILVNFAVMGFTGIKLNLGTSMVAGVSVGIGIDYSIHFLEAFKREKAKGGEGFLWRSFNSSGKAIIINAVSVGMGFAVLLLSRFNMLVDLGLLIAITMFTSALVSLTVLPALLLLLKPKFAGREAGGQE